MMMSWEYKVVIIELTAKTLNKYGLDGWELVSIDANSKASIPANCRCVFKRQLREVNA